MSNETEKEKDRKAKEWFTNPLYKILVIGLTLLVLLDKEMDGGMKQTVRIVLWTGLGLIVIVNVVHLITSFGSRKEEKKEDDEN